MKKQEIDDAYIAYQLDLIKRKNEVCSRLLTMRDLTVNRTYKKWLLDAVEFIQEEYR